MSFVEQEARIGENLCSIAKPPACTEDQEIHLDPGTQIIAEKPGPPLDEVDFGNYYNDGAVMVLKRFVRLNFLWCGQQSPPMGLINRDIGDVHTAVQW